ncbi:NAD(P)-binding protein [Pseudovirgaria hyperparasitica]|uniref:NAD(P)-binding protein n=1 Tax=Pseudovirgaria hyperparasitica TaxID=470096 RepID=A0A6A6VTK7_9PEZI|nr:NAD(P)-binding protein [Pseudovirgaria hyperparasitica]KAF2753485.1 NAD(P)-binding protein [Pseudovirgaria hyperparasitica]
MAPWALVSPASRGIGFALTRHILQTSRVPVVATVRKDRDVVKEQLLDGLGADEGRLHVLECDVLDESSIEAASSRCEDLFPVKEGNGLHLGLVIPGILFPEKSPRQIDADNALLTFRTNTLGPLLMLKHFEHFLPTKQINNTSASEVEGLPSAAIMALMSARVGSITDNKLGGWYSYRASKAAINQVVKTFDNYLRTKAGDEAFSVGLHPGTVKTGLSKEFWGSVKKEKLFEREWVAERLIDVLREKAKKVEESRGRCWDWDAKEVSP